VPDRVTTVLFMFPDSRQIRHMGKPPRLGSRVRSPRGAVWTVAEVKDWGTDAYAVTCVGTSRAAPVPHQEVDHVNEVIKHGKRHRDDKTLAADLLQRAKQSLSPRAIRRRRRDRSRVYPYGM
jgi:hypothetical protein